jgi:polar amino acid transport system permease protein
MKDLSPYLPFLLSGLWTTLEVLVCSSLVMAATAVIVGTARLSPRWYVRAPATFFVEFLRGTSAIVQLFWAFYVLPFAGISLPPLITAVLVLGLNEGSYASEIVRSGIKSVPVGQFEATVALNLKSWSRFWRIIMPQAITFMIPPFGNTLINLLKLTSLASLVTVSDLTFRAQSIRASIGQTPLIFGIILVLYFAVSMVISLLTVAAERIARSRFGETPRDGSDDWRASLRALLTSARTLPGSRAAGKQREVTNS